MENEPSYFSQLDELFETPHCLQVYTEDDYRELEENITLYQNGSLEASSYIIKVFHPFLLKYTNFISGNRIRITYTPSIKRFIHLFDGTKKRGSFLATSKKIQYLYAQFRKEEIYNELVCALLDMASRYKNMSKQKTTGSFPSYVTKNFHFYAFRRLSELTKDPISQQMVSEFIDTEKDFDDPNEKKEVLLKDESSEWDYELALNKVERENRIQNTKRLSVEEHGITDYDLESLNFNWINGVTCSKLFDCLTPYERELIVLYYIKRKTDENIGAIYGLNRITINRHRSIAIEKLKQSASKLCRIKRKDEEE